MTTSTRRGVTGRRIAAGLVAAASIGAFAGLASGAFFTDSASIDNNTFSFGTVALSTNPTTSLFNMTGVLPGDSKVGTLNVKNDGTMQMRYAMSDTVTDAVIGSTFKMTVKSGVADCTAAGFAGSGTVVYDGILGSTTGTKVLGDKAVGQQAGDRVVNAGATDALCVLVSTPTTVDNSVQGLTGNGTFQFDAEQTANNA
jgi:hypothetical protein